MNLQYLISSDSPSLTKENNPFAEYPIEKRHEDIESLESEFYCRLGELSVDEANDYLEQAARILFYPYLTFDGMYYNSDCFMQYIMEQLVAEMVSENLSVDFYDVRYDILNTVDNLVYHYSYIDYLLGYRIGCEDDYQGDRSTVAEDDFLGDENEIYERSGELASSRMDDYQFMLSSSYLTNAFVNLICKIGEDGIKVTVNVGIDSIGRVTVNHEEECIFPDIALLELFNTSIPMYMADSSIARLMELISPEGSYIVRFHRLREVIKNNEEPYMELLRNVDLFKRVRIERR